MLLSLMCLLIILTIASVSAVDLNGDMVPIDDNDEGLMEITEDNDDIISEGEDVEVLAANYTPRTSSEIQSYVDNANSGDTIILDGNYVLQSTIAVNKPLNFIGINNATVDGSSNVKLFKVYTSGVIFKNIIFKNGATKDNGTIGDVSAGAIYGSGGYSPYIENCIFINNSARGDGGAIYFCRAINCKFINNVAENGGAMFSSTAINCSFFNNSARKNGGAIYSTNAVECFFENNSVTEHLGSDYGGGGAICGGSAENCTFVNNHADYGSAMYLKNAKNCIFINNSDSALYKGNADNCSFLNGGSIDSGSAINCRFNNCDRVKSSTLTNCTLMNNIKGAVYKCISINCSFVNNSAEYGGAMFGGSAINCSFVNNSAREGGAMVGDSAINCSFINNSATRLGGAAFFGSHDTHSGQRYIANLCNCSFVNNSAVYGGAVSSHFPDYYTTDAMNVINITYCCFINNSATLNGGTIEISHNFRQFNVSDCIFINSTSNNGYGGAIYGIKEGYVSNSSFNNCSSNKGGAIWTQSTINIHLSNFTNCSSNDGSSYLGSEDLNLYNISDCIFDIVPEGINYHYYTILTVNNLFIAKGEKGILYANLSNLRGPIVNKRVIFEFNGRKFYSVTNSEGIAEFNVNNYLNNLGETIIDLSFAGDDINYPSFANSSVYINKYHGNLTVSLDGKFFNDTYLIFKLVNPINNVPISGAPIKLNFSNGEVINLTTNINGDATYRIPFIPDTYDVSAYVDEEYVNVNNVSVNNIIIKKLVGEVKITPINDNHTLMIELVDLDDLSAVYRNVKINLEFGPDEYLYDEVITNENGIAIYDLLNFTIGTYSVLASVEGDYKEFFDDYKELVISHLLNSKINFTNNITFDFGDYGSTNFTVNGGTVEYSNIKVVDHPEAIIGLSDNTITVSYLSVGNYVLMVQTTPDEYHNAINATLNITVNNAKSKVTFSAGMVFEYGTSSSIHVIVEGGKIELKNIRIVGHPEALIKFTGNVITVSGLAVGSYTMSVTTTPDSDHVASTGTVPITVKKATAVIKASKITVAYKKAGKWTIKFVDSKSGKAISNMKVTLKVYSGSKFKTVTLTTNSKGEANYQTKGLSKGNHKVVVSAKDNRYNFNTFTSSIKVIKQTAVKFKVTRKTLKDGASLSITVKNKKTNKPINGVKIELLIYTGSKLTKTVLLKTLKKGKYSGVAGYATNELKAGKHKVKITTADIKYGGSAKSSLKITKQAKKYPALSTKISAKV